MRRERDARDLQGAKVAAQRDGEQQPAHRVGQRCNARAEQLFDGLGERHVLADLQRPAFGERAPELEREQRVAERGLDNAAQHVPRQAQSQALREQPLRRGEAQRADLEPLHAVRALCPLERRRAARALREQKADRVVAEASGGEGDCVRGRGVEPLHVVDRDEQRTSRGERADGAQEAHAERSGRWWVGRGLRAQERYLERVQLRRGHVRQLFGGDAVEQIGQRRERELCLGPARPRGQHAQPPPSGHVEPGFPERRLADPRPTRQNERARRLVRTNELVQGTQLRLAADDPPVLLCRRFQDDPLRGRNTAPDEPQVSLLECLTKQRLRSVHSTCSLTRFGFDAFRPGQEQVVEALLAGRSALAVFPTGAGKSICYQLPALLLEGMTIVVSPLIALMKDQIDFLQRNGIDAARLDSSLDAAEQREIFDRLRAGSLKLLYVAPERFNNERFLAQLARARISLFAVDEAHCISEWGHNFRPDYLKLAERARELEAERVLALTATATPAVVADIRAGFGIEEADAVVTGFYRPNLTLLTTPVVAARARRAAGGAAARASSRIDDRVRDAPADVGADRRPPRGAPVCRPVPITPA